MTARGNFHGGVSPPANKRQSTGEPIRAAGLADELIFPLFQATGITLTPVVTVGQTVLKGELIAGWAANGARLHASTSGTVTAIESRPIAHAVTTDALCIVLRPDGEDRWLQHEGLADYPTADRNELLARIRAAGIQGLGGAAFPTADKLDTALAANIDTLIINGAECEPYLSADDLLMRERAADVIGGATILRHLLQPQQTLIGVEDDKPEAIAALQAAAADSGIGIVAVPARYPAGGEQQLIQLLTGREVPSGGLPADIGVLCQNVGTAAAVFAAVVRGEPALSRIVTITGGACASPRNYEAPFGTPLRHLLAQSGYETGRCTRLLVGGPMMGYPLLDAAAPVTSATNCVLAVTATELPQRQPRACIRCGLCAEVCPASLLPQQLYRFARNGDHARLASHHLFDCIECGACDYICPSHIPLVDFYRQAKTELLELEQQHVDAVRAKARFEAHQQRVAREAAERAERRQARREAQAAPTVAVAATAPVDDRLSVVQAAIARAKAKKTAPATGQRPAAAALTDDPADQLAALRRRLANAEQKLPMLRRQNSPKLAELEASVAQLRAQLAAAEAENPPP